MEELRIYVKKQNVIETFFICKLHLPTALRNIGKRMNGLELLNRKRVAAKGKICAVCYEQDPTGHGIEPLKMGSTTFRYP